MEHLLTHIYPTGNSCYVWFAAGVFILEIFSFENLGRANFRARKLHGERKKEKAPRNIKKEDKYRGTPGGAVSY